ncbi:Response regulator receiver protein [Paraburkholderia piptadeniae]|uniref:histidine kinase n=1 Tax=Paraburkholderia piptadeniae TaxID=1701573 RepID=A0A1N7S7C2_9BURK|nr:response regulator [Paraburkholderia piptadeniae]SIT43229.1 Response regulator receiver protein [Paraburkholderia piptadeniae]
MTLRRATDALSFSVRTVGSSSLACALALFGSLAAYCGPLAGASAAAVLLLARALHVIARKGEVHRTLSLANEKLSASLRVARQDNEALEAEIARAADEAGQAARAAALAEHARTLARMRRAIVPPIRVLYDASTLSDIAGEPFAARRAINASHIYRCAARTLAQVAHDALDLLPPYERNIVLDEDTVDLRELFDAAALLLAPVAAARRIRMQMCIDRSVAACVLADGTRLGQILFGLLAYAIEEADAGTLTVAARAESLNAGAQRIVIGINGPAGALPAMSTARDARNGRSGAHPAVAESADFREHPDLALCREIARRMGGDITVLQGRSVGVCVAIHAPFTIERHDWPVLEHERRWATVDLETYEDRQALCELLKKLGVTALPSDAKPPVRIDYHFAGASRPPSPHGAKRTIVMTRDVLPGGIRETDGGVELSLSPLSWTALRRVCDTRDETPPARAVPLRAQVRPSSGRATILVTDDNEVNRKVLARQLDVLGYRCIAACSGEEALDVLSRERIDLLITDLQMPGMDGVELARHVRAMFSICREPLPIILLSANPDMKATNGSDRAMFAAILVKTASLSTIDACLKRLLPGSAQDRAAPPARRLEAYDFTALDSLAEQGVDVDSLLRDWRKSMDDDLARLERCRASGEAQGIRSALHKLAGAVGIVGSRSMMNALQRASAAKQPVDGGLLDGLVAQMRALMIELDCSLARWTFRP